MHVECTQRVLVCMCVWCVEVWRGVWCGVYVRVCAECECDQKQTSLPLGPFTEYTRRQTAHTSLPWDCSPQGTDYTDRPTPGTPLGVPGCVVCTYIYIHDSICVSVHAYVRDCVVFQCTHMVVCMIDKPSPGTLLKASTQ